MVKRREKKTNKGEYWFMSFGKAKIMRMKREEGRESLKGEKLI